MTRTKVPGSKEEFRSRQLKAQQMLRGDLEGADLDEYVEKSVLLTRFEDAQNWARKNAIFPLGFGLACCAMEMISVIGSPRNDLARFGAEAIRFTPRQADLLILSGRVSIKMAPVIRRIYEQMLEPKWVISMGACASSAGMFNNYALVAGADKFLPIDVYVPGCPPRPEALIYGIMQLQDKIQGSPHQGWRERYRSAGTEETGRQPRRPRAHGRGRRAPMPDATGLELVAQRVRDAVGDDAVVDTLHAHGQATLQVAPGVGARRAGPPARRRRRALRDAGQRPRLRLPARGAAAGRALPAAEHGAGRAPEREDPPGRRGAEAAPP